MSESYVTAAMLYKYAYVNWRVNSLKCDFCGQLNLNQKIIFVKILVYISFILRSLLNDLNCYLD